MQLRQRCPPTTLTEVVCGSSEGNSEMVEPTFVVPPSRPLSPATRFGSSGGTPLSDATVLDYWLWAFSNLWGNTERGQLAEFVVARAH